MAQYNFIQQATFRFPRLIGIAFLALGCFLLYDGFLSPMNQVKHNVPEVTFSLSSFLIGVLVIPIAIFIIITGDKYLKYIFMQPHEIRQSVGSKPYYVVFGAFMLLLVVAYYFFEHYLTSIGYNTK